MRIRLTGRRLVLASVVAVLAATGVLLVAAGAGAGPATVKATTAHGAPLDHFQCYRADQKGKVPQRQVTLIDQFGQSEGRTHRPQLLCNPVEKRHGAAVTPISSPESHLKCYDLKDKTATKQHPLVLVRNQFGEDVLQVDGATRLCLPTSKAPAGAQPGPIPTDLDHFKCYKAKSPRQATPTPVVLTDQFESAQTFVLEPIELCNPVEKRFAGQVTPIQHPDEHLVCYRLEPRPSTTRAVLTRNQFAVEDLRVDEARMLCVPSQKRRVDGGPGEQPQGLEHFQCYDSVPFQPFPPRPVFLQDQFGPGDAIVHDPFLLCNPVSKNEGPVQDRESHLVCYRIDDKAEQRIRHVEIRNQFGGDVLETAKSYALCVPSSKSLDPAVLPPPLDPASSHLDHFKCYRAKGFVARKLAVSLLDQFGPINVKVGKVIALCNPVEKQHGGQVTPVQNPQAHLVCYQIGGPFDVRSVATNNQFGPLQLRVEKRRMLCLPSFKRQIQ